MGQDDQVGLGRTLATHLIGFALQHGVNADVGLGQDAGHAGQHASLVGHTQAQVVAGHHLAHRQHRQFGLGLVQRVRLERQMRHTVERVHRVQAGDVHQVGNHRAGGWLRASTLAIVEGGAHRIALHHHGIHRALHIGDQALGRHQARVHPQFHAARCAFGNAQQLDAVAELFGIFDVGRAQLGNAFDIGPVKLHRNAERDGRHDGDFVRRVHALDVEGRVGLGITQTLGLFQSHIEIQPLVTHLRQDEVGGAVDDAGDPLNSVGSQPFAQRLDDRDATRHSGFKRHHHATG